MGVDGRPNGRDAIALASRLTDPDGKLMLAHVHSGPLHPSHTITPASRSVRRPTSCSNRSALRRMSRRSSSASCREAPAAALHQQAEEQGADLLVVGSCGHGAFGRDARR